MRIRTLVIDDEPLARSRILRLLAMYPEIDVIGEARNGQEALKQIRNFQPDLIFLDILMPDLNGFEVLEMRGSEHRPFIIFVTAFDQYAVKAFEVQAVDYLLKPYDDQRFAQALDHARSQILLTQRKPDTLAGHADQDQPEDLPAIPVKDPSGTTKYLRADRIVGVRADGNYLHTYTVDSRFLLRMTLAEMEERLPSPMFLRIHRSYLVNRLHILEVRYQGNNTYRFIMANRQSWVSSRGQKKEIKRYLNAGSNS
ncbi:MAG: response regulator transcription factor [Saprospiraceae bacterium]|nr:response regulator transcription factor [Saprospiraceae bacterium]